MRRLQGLLLLVATVSVTIGSVGCMPFGWQRSKARVAEMETTTRVSGSASTLRTEVDYLSDGRIDEITRTAEGDFIDRWELSWDKNNRVEEVAIISDNDTVLIELSYTGQLLTEARARFDDDAYDLRWDISYFNGDRRFVESTVTTMDTPSSFSEVTTRYSYDDASRIKEVVSSIFQESSFNGATSESKTETDLRYDVDTGKLERITRTTEVPYTPAPVTDWCAQSGYYGDGFCDSGCPQPDPDCGAGGGVVEPDEPQTEYVTNTSLYSVKYDDDGRLEEMNGPEGERFAIDYDQEGRIDEVEQRSDGYSVVTEYSYDEGVVLGHSFSPAMPSGEFFDLVGASFGTLEIEGPLQIIQLPAGAASSGAND